MRLHILGAGTPYADAGRFGSSYILEVGGERIMFDCGPGTTYKMARMGLRTTDVDHLLFTHHHFDHDVDYPCFLLARWNESIGDENPLQVIGPTFAGALMGLLAQEDDRQLIRMRMPPPEDPSRSWDRPLLLWLAVSWDPIRASTMRENELAGELMRAFRQAIDAAGAPGRVDTAH